MSKLLKKIDRIKSITTQYIGECAQIKDRKGKVQITKEFLQALWWTATHD